MNIKKAEKKDLENTFVSKFFSIILNLFILFLFLNILQKDTYYESYILY